MVAAADVRHFPPPTAPEIAFLGRSNVGKSSVLNSLLGEKIARTSSTPGRTRTINFFAIRRSGAPQPDFVFTDLPGYGYAKLPRAVTAEWPEFIEPYLRERPNLALCVCLVDSNIPPQASDRKLMDFLSATGRKYLVIGTKADRISGNQLRNSLAAMCRDLQVERVLPYSARTGAGRDELWREIRTAAVVSG